MAGLLEGVRVLDLSIWRPGPYATQLLVEMGADVVKVEPPGGDPMRVFPALFADLNAGKRSAAVDLKAPVGRAAVLERAAGADVVIEGFRPGVAARLGVGEVDVRAVNPTVVYCSISGYGQDGPLVAAAGHDINYQAWAGVLEPPAGRRRAGARPPTHRRPGRRGVRGHGRVRRPRAPGAERRGRVHRRGHDRRARLVDRRRATAHAARRPSPRGSGGGLRPLPGPRRRGSPSAS